MRIEKLFIPWATSLTVGLEEINLKRLGPVVALVGRNGSYSGKSFPDKVFECFFIVIANEADVN
jgi:hypothetical protein